LNTKLKYIGIDGCRSGWFYVGFDMKNSYSFGIIPTIRDMDSLTAGNSIVCIDIPIGLREHHQIERQCDLQARKLLQKKRSSIFPAPSRLALTAGDYHCASRMNYECTGRRLSRQTYNIMPKIKEVDDHLPLLPQRVRVMEFHPELSFLSLNGFQPLIFSKKGKQGQLERQKILEKHFKPVSRIVQTASERFLRKHVAVDDVIDAIAGAVTAMLNCQIVSIPEIPELITGA